MTCDDHKFSCLSYIYSKIIVTNANCMSSPIISSGTVLFLPFSQISEVLFISSLNCNLLSVSKISKSHNCFVLFFPTHCILQNIHTKKRIDSGKTRGDLYYLDSGFQQPPKKAPANVMSETMLTSKQMKIWIWHR